MHGDIGSTKIEMDIVYYEVGTGTFFVLSGNLLL
jgi:hypothetical protein